ncbi:TetR/AcrR family transcriptional regulator [Paenibacillus sp. Z6-24]
MPKNMNSDKQHETKIKLTAKLLPYVRKNGFQSLRMEDISKIMDVSRATLYKYFSTKEEIIDYVVDRFIEYIHEASMEHNSDQQFSVRFQQIFEQSVLLVEYATDIFLKELASIYPDIHEKISSAIKERESMLLDFYNDGIKRGIFNEINGKLVIAQNEILRHVLDIRYLMENQLTVHQVLLDYYHLQKIQLFRPDKLSMVDDQLIMPQLDYLAKKISKNLY